MNKKIIKAVMAIAIVFLVAAMPISGIIGNGIVRVVKGDEAGGVVGNVAPTVQSAMTTGGDTEVYNSGSDSLTFNASIRDRNREDDIGNVDDTPTSCWFNISSATTGNYTNYTIKIAATSLSSSQANMYNSTSAPNDGILVLSSTTDDSTQGFQWTCPAVWEVATDYIANLTITDNNGETCYTTITFTVKSAIKIIGIYNYTGLAVFKDSPFYWNFTSTYPATLNVTSGNWSYTYDDAANNKGYDNATGRQWSYWLVVNNSGGVSTQAFNVSFAIAGFTNITYPGTPIPTSDYIRFEYYRTTTLTWANNDTAGSGAEPSIFSGTTTYTADGTTKYGVTGDGSADAKVRFEFDAGLQNIWIRFMVDIPDPCRDATGYTCTYAVLGG